MLKWPVILFVSHVKFSATIGSSFYLLTQIATAKACIIGKLLCLYIMIVKVSDIYSMVGEVTEPQKMIAQVTDLHNIIG